MSLSKLPADGHVTTAKARFRALNCLAAKRGGDYVPLSWIGAHIWPNSTMRAQGLALAASKIVRGLLNELLVQWNCDGVGNRRAWGYSITAKGRTELARLCGFIRP